MKDTHPHKREAPAHLCDRCNRDLAYSNEMLAERADLWTAASSMLNNRDFSGDGNDVTPDDIMTLTLFLAGENG